MKTEGGDVILIRGVGKIDMIFDSGGKAVPVTLDEVLVVPGCRCDLLSFRARDRSGKCLTGGDGVISLLDGKLKLPIRGGLY